MDSQNGHNTDTGTWKFPSKDVLRQIFEEQLQFLNEIENDPMLFSTLLVHLEQKAGLILSAEEIVQHITTGSELVTGKVAIHSDAIKHLLIEILISDRSFAIQAHALVEGISQEEWETLYVLPVERTNEFLKHIEHNDVALALTSMITQQRILAIIGLPIDEKVRVLAPVIAFWEKIESFQKAETAQPLVESLRKHTEEKPYDQALLLVAAFEAWQSHQHGSHFDIGQFQVQLEEISQFLIAADKGLAKALYGFALHDGINRVTPKLLRAIIYWNSFKQIQEAAAADDANAKFLLEAMDYLNILQYVMKICRTWNQKNEDPQTFETEVQRAQIIISLFNEIQAEKLD